MREEGRRERGVWLGVILGEGGEREEKRGEEVLKVTA